MSLCVCLVHPPPWVLFWRERSLLCSSCCPGTHYVVQSGFFCLLSARTYPNFETGSYCLTQASLELTALFLQLPDWGCWDYRCVLPNSFSFDQMFKLRILKSSGSGSRLTRSTQEGEAGGSPWVQCQPGMQSEFQDIQGYKQRNPVSKTYQK